MQTGNCQLIVNRQRSGNIPVEIRIRRPERTCDCRQDDSHQHAYIPKNGFGVIQRNSMRRDSSPSKWVKTICLAAAGTSVPARSGHSTTRIAPSAR